MQQLKVKHIIEILEKWAPKSISEHYDNCGLLVGSEKTKLTGVLTTLDCTEEVVEEAIKKKCNLIVSHHPIIFSGLKKITGSNYIERVIIKAIQHQIAIFAFHTNLDNVVNGVNATITNLLGIKNTQPLVPKENYLKKLVIYVPKSSSTKVRKALFEAGAGHIGDYSHCSFNTKGIGTFFPLENTTPTSGKKMQLNYETEEKIETVFPFYLEQNLIKALKSAHPYEEIAYDIHLLENTNHNIGSGIIGNLDKELSTKVFLELVKKKFKLKTFKHTSLCKSVVSKIAVCGGSGSFLLKKAIASNANVFITSDFKYHEFFDAENKLIIIDIGHYESEQFTKTLISSYLIRKLPNFAVYDSTINTNPVNYY